MPVRCRSAGIVSLHAVLSFEAGTQRAWFITGSQGR